MEDVSHLTGEKDLKSPPKNLALNEVRFNGKDGVFTYVNLLERKDGEQAQTIDLGPSIQAVFLKIRRRLGGFNVSDTSSSKDGTFYVSTEHNTKEDTVYLFGARERGVAETLYEKHKPILKAQRVIYAYLLRKDLPKELVRIVVKGSSLMADREEQENKSTSLLDYVSREKGKDEHMYNFVTILSAVKKKGRLGAYFAIDFMEGKKLPDEKMPEVIEKIKEIAKVSSEQDAYYKENTPAPTAVELPVIEYPDTESEGVNIDDIPF